MSTGGPGTWPTVAAAMAGARAAYTAAAAVALAGQDPAVQIVAGDALDWIGRGTGHVFVGVEPDTSDLRDGTVSPTRREQHAVRLTVTVAAWCMTENDVEPIDRVWSLLGVIDEHVRRHDPDLGHEVLWARITETKAASGEAKAGGYSGRAAEVVATVECGVIAAVR